MSVYFNTGQQPVQQQKIYEDHKVASGEDLCKTAIVALGVFVLIAGGAACAGAGFGLGMVPLAAVGVVLLTVGGFSAIGGIVAGPEGVLVCVAYSVMILGRVLLEVSCAICIAALCSGKQ